MRASFPECLAYQPMGLGGSDWPWLTHTWPRNPYIEVYLIKQIFFGDKKKRMNHDFMGVRQNEIDETS